MDTEANGPRRIVSLAFARVQDGVYVVLGLLLAVTVGALLVRSGLDLFRAISGGVEVKAIVVLLDRILLALMVVELMYTLQVSLREHVLVPEPFLLLALIAAVRRILVITAEFGAQSHPNDAVFRQVMWELALLTALIVVLVASVVILRRRSGPPPPAR